VTSLVAQTVKASAYNAGDPGMIPVSGRFPGEGKTYLQKINPKQLRKW